MSKVYAVLLVLLTLLAAAVTFVPFTILQPYKAQTGNDLAVAYQLFRWAPLVTLLALALGTALNVFLWRCKPSWWLRVPMFLLVLVLAGLSFFARLNPYERMFAPITEAGFVQVAEAEHMVGEEMVLGVRIGSQAKAYPVGMLAYHHVVNDEIGGVPLVVTY